MARAVDLLLLSNSSSTVPKIIAPVATGAMILGTVLDELERSNKSTALATLCVGGGMGTAVPIPPPTQSVARAVDLLLLSNSSSTVPKIIAPVATGAMILGTVLDELERSNKSTALATLCVGGGMGTATVIERV